MVAYILTHNCCCHIKWLFKNVSALCGRRTYAIIGYFLINSEHNFAMIRPFDKTIPVH